MSIGKIFFFALLMFAIAGLVYTGVWHLFTEFVWQHPMLSWLPILTVIVVGFAIKGIRSLTSSGSPAATTPPPPPSAEVEPPVAAGGTPAVAGDAPPPVAPAPSGPSFALGWGLLAGLIVLMIGLYYTLLNTPRIPIDEIDYEVVQELPERTQPRLLPRSGVDDDPRFREASEIHLVRNPSSGELAWSGEWQSSWLGAKSAGVVEKPLDDVVSESQIIQTGFSHSVGGITPGTLKGKARLDHPFSGIQYPILVPNGNKPAFAMAPYVGYEGFPFRTPYFKGVLVYHQDGTLEDLSPEEAASRPELVRTGRIVPEEVARAEAEAIADTEEFKGDIHDGEGNKQPFLTAIDRDHTMWVTIIDSEEINEGVKAVVLADSSTGETQVWTPPQGQKLISTEDVLNQARSLPLKWEEERCCDSEGHSYTVTLREVVEPRLVFKDGKPFYLVTVVPTDDLALPREVEHTLLIDAETGARLDQFEHVNEGPAADARLQAFFD